MASNRTDLTLMLDNRANVSKETVGLVKISGNNINVFEINADGTTFPTQITFNNIVIPNYQNTIVSRNARIRYQMVVQCDQSHNAGPTAVNDPYFPAPVYNAWAGGSANPGATVVGQINAVLRDFPLQSNCNNVQLIINGATCTMNAQQVLPAVKRTLPSEWLKRQATECPSMADNAIGFYNALDAASVWGGTAGGTTAGQNFVGVPVGAGHSNQVFSGYFNSDGTTRGCFIATTLANPGANNATYTFDVSESILISPFTIYDDEVWLSNINTMSLQFNYSSLLDAVLYANPTIISTAPLSVTVNNPRLELSYMNLSPDLVTIGRVTTLPYENIIYFPKSLGNLNLINGGAFQTYSVQSDTLRFSSLPEKIIAFLRPSMANRVSAAPSSQADAFLAVGDASGLANIQVSIGTRTGLLASASTKTIYRMAKKNGYNGSFANWLINGGLIIIDPVTDLGVDVSAGDVLPGESGSVNFQINAMFNNSNVLMCGGTNIAYGQAAVPCELMVVVVYSGTANITPDGCTFNTGELSKNEVDTLLKVAPKDGTMSSSQTFRPTIGGAGLFSTFKSVLGTAANALKSDVGQKALGLASNYLNKKGGVLSAAGLKR